MMAGIRGKNTRTEIAIRRCLFARGFRFRLHDASLPGRPDIVLAKYRAAVFVHGCFWHGHDCRLFRVPASNRSFWAAKIRRNRMRDREVMRELAQLGWRTLVIWECSFRDGGEKARSRVCRRAAEWLVSRSRRAEVRGRR
ncbi:MAG: very short patch repair endonuclease [Nitrospira sp.]|nr:very short patch repair endonuclease [Nitrospira sp.]